MHFVLKTLLLYSVPNLKDFIQQYNDLYVFTIYILGKIVSK